jgi:hypothetical protein
MRAATILLHSLKLALFLAALPLSLTGKAQAPKPDPVAELKKACEAGTYTQEDCARRLGILLGQQAHADARTGSAADSGHRYNDPQGRFSLHIPDGWTATAKGDNGSLGVQLRSGSNWINLMPASAASTRDVVLDQEQKVLAQSHSDRKAPFGPAGLIQLFGSGVELTYDNFTGVSTDGSSIESYIGGVTNLTGSTHAYLLLVASLRKDPDSKGGATFLATAQSIRLPNP